jgi:Do/DeqQ family serine protease
MYLPNDRHQSLRRPTWLATFGLATFTLVAGAAGTRAHLAAAAGPEPAARAAEETAERAPLPSVPSYSGIVDKVAPAVVTVRVEGRATATPTMLPGMPGIPGLPEGLEPFFGGPRSRRGAPQPAPRRSGLGSGVVIKGDGYILTNHHVIDGAEKIRVEFSDGRALSATIVGSDQPTDLAVLKVDETGLATVPYGDSDEAKVGDVVLAFGNPLGVGQTVTMGIVSAKSRATGVGDGSYEDFLQTDAPINQGNSGGALVNLQGELLGINAQIVSPSGGNIGLGFAIPASMARAVADQLMKDGKVHRSKLGVTVQGVTPELAEGLGMPQVRGALISGVEKDSPGDKAGLREGDVVTAIDGHPVADSNALRNKVASIAPNTAITLTVLRDGKETTLSAKVVAREAEMADASTPVEKGEAAEKLGMSVAPLTPQIAEEMDLPATATGVVVTEVEPDSVAAEAGFRAGDVVKKVNGRDVKTVNELRDAMAARKKGPAMVLVARNGGSLFVAVPAAKS